MGYHRVQGIRLARVLALEAAYRWDLLDEEPEKALEDIFEREKPPDKVKKLAREIIETLAQHHQAIDDLIRDSSINWQLERMPLIDRSILRVAVSEMLANPEVGKNIVIDEAVELAKTFSTNEARAFINGVLDTIASKIQNEQPQSD